MSEHKCKGHLEGHQDNPTDLSLPPSGVIQEIVDKTTKRVLVEENAVRHNQVSRHTAQELDLARQRSADDCRAKLNRGRKGRAQVLPTYQYQPSYDDPRGLGYVEPTELGGSFLL